MLPAAQSDGASILSGNAVCSDGIPADKGSESWEGKSTTRRSIVKTRENIYPWDCELIVLPHTSAMASFVYLLLAE